jgi:hypothetical protein
MRHAAGCWLFALAATLLGVPASASASDYEVRDFDILVDGKLAGQSRVTLIQEDDGSAYMKATVKVKIQKLFSYNLDVEAQEWWKGTKLVALKATSQENRKRNEVAIVGDGKQLSVTANGQTRSLHPDSWTTSYWKLPDARFHNKEIPVVETDTGSIFTARLTFKGTEKLTVGGKLEECYRFQVSGVLSPTDLWFDRYHRLVRQEFVEAGHQTIVQINAIRR